MSEKLETKFDHLNGQNIDSRKSVKGEQVRVQNPYTPLKSGKEKPKLLPKPQLDQILTPNASPVSLAKHSRNRSQTNPQNVKIQTSPKPQSPVRSGNSLMAESKIGKLIATFDDKEIEQDVYVEMKRVLENEEDTQDCHKYYYLELASQAASKIVPLPPINANKELKIDKSPKRSCGTKEDKLSEMLYLAPQNQTIPLKIEKNPNNSSIERVAIPKAEKSASTTQPLNIYYEMTEDEVQRLKPQETSSKRTGKLHSKEKANKVRNLSPKKSIDTAKTSREAIFEDFSEGSELAKLGNILREDMESPKKMPPRRQISKKEK